MIIRKIVALLCALAGASAFAEAITHEMVTVDPALPAYQPSATPLNGKITVISRDRLEKVAVRWLDRFHAAHAGVVGANQADGQGNPNDKTWDDTVPYSLLPIVGGGKFVVQKRRAT